MKRKIAGILIILVLVAGGAYWAGATLSRKTFTPEPSPTPALVTVSEQTVGRTLDLAASIESQLAPVAANQLAGVITWVSDAREFGQGDPVYAVAGVPVRVVSGDTPFYRELAPGTRGSDVHQLTQLLTDLGYLRRADSEFGPVTEKAVKAWQKSQGREETGTIQLGELVAIPSIPTTLVLDRKIAKPGLDLQGGENIISATTGDPNVYLMVSEQQRNLIPAGAAVTLQNGEQKWRVAISDMNQRTEDGFYKISLKGEDGGPACGAECEGLGGGEGVSLPAAVEVIPAVTGPAVPRAAIMTNAKGESYVVDEAGNHIAITMKGAAEGIAVVEGVEPGTTIRVFGEAGA